MAKEQATFDKAKLIFLNALEEDSKETVKQLKTVVEKLEEVIAGLSDTHEI